MNIGEGEALSLWLNVVALRGREMIVASRVSCTWGVGGLEVGPTIGGLSHHELTSPSLKESPLHLQLDL